VKARLSADVLGVTVLLSVCSCAVQSLGSGERSRHRGIDSWKTTDLDEDVPWIRALNWLRI